MLAVHGTHPHTPDALLRLADGARYRAKREGRNRVVGVNVGSQRQIENHIT
ncbi:hypothetical protein [uncultured Pseudacidovorax sp.]|uniref:hypothetical protein n=1 Tax=uncultured Pseudacidovorax sp. TaxID=679313 RepID=UPI0025E83492|nr:hypothetical protein [uncultured Pseudacidovorax sp.]